MTTAEQHALKMVLQDGGMQVVITCLGHDECEAVRRIEEEAATAFYGNKYSLFEEYYSGGAAPIQSNLIDLKTIDRNEFITWQFTAEHPTIDELKNRFESDIDGHVLIPYIEYNDFVAPEIVCVGPHANNDEPCLGENLREYLGETGEMWSGFVGTEGTTLRSGPIIIKNNSDHEWVMVWDYA